MRVKNWRLTIYKGRTAEVRDEFTSDTRASRLRGVEAELRASPFGPTCWDMTFTGVTEAGGVGVSAALLDTVELRLNDLLVYAGRVSRLPGFGVQDMTFQVQGHYRLAKAVFPAVGIKNYTGALWPMLKTVLEAKLGAGNVLVPEDDLTVQVRNWTIDDQNIKLDALARRVSDLLGGGVAYGFRADSKFVMGRRPLEPTRTLGIGDFQEREAPLANRLYVKTGYDNPEFMVIEEGESIVRDGPLEEAEDLSNLIAWTPAGLFPMGEHQAALILDYSDGVRYSLLGGTGISLYSYDDGVNVNTNVPKAPTSGGGYDAEIIFGRLTPPNNPVITYGQAFLPFIGLPVRPGTTVTAATLYVRHYSGVTDASEKVSAFEVRQVSSAAFMPLATLRSTPALATHPALSGINPAARVALNPVPFQAGGEIMLMLTTVEQRVRAGNATDYGQLGRYGESKPWRVIERVRATDDHLRFGWGYAGVMEGNMQAFAQTIDLVTGQQTAYQSGLAVRGEPGPTFFLDLGLGSQLRTNATNMNGNLISFQQIRDHANNLFVEKYGPTLQATATLEGAYEPPGGRGHYRYGDGQSALLIDYSAKIIIDDQGVQTVMTGGSKTRYNAAQRSRIEIEDLNRRLSSVETP